MLKEFPLQSCVNLFRATYGVGCACSVEDKHTNLTQWRYWQENGAWLDGRLEFEMQEQHKHPHSKRQVVQFECTPLEYQLLSWDLPDLAQAMELVGPQDRVVLPNLSKNLKVFSTTHKNIHTAFDSEFDNVAVRFQTWARTFGQTFCSPFHTFSPWQAVCARAFSNSERTVGYLKTLRTHWPLMGEDQLETTKNMVYSNLRQIPVFDDVAQKSLPLGTLIALMGFTQQAQTTDVYQSILNALPHTDRAQIEQWGICLALDASNITSVRARKM